MEKMENKWKWKLWLYRGYIGDTFQVARCAKGGGCQNGAVAEMVMAVLSRYLSRPFSAFHRQGKEAQELSSPATSTKPEIMPGGLTILVCCFFCRILLRSRFQEVEGFCTCW